MQSRATRRWLITHEKTIKHLSHSGGGGGRDFSSVVYVKFIRRFVPLVFVPVTLLFGSFGTPGWFRHDDLIVHHTKRKSRGMLAVMTHSL